MQNNSIKNVVATGIGAALFIIVGIFINIPIFGNTSLQLQFAVLALFATIFGPIPGFLIGLLGHGLKDAIQYGNVSWFWILASGLVGLGIGLFRRYYNVEKGIFGIKEIVIFNAVQVISVFLAFNLICPVGDKLLYNQAWNYLFTQGFVASLANVITIAVGGTLLLTIYAKTRTKDGSLSKD